VDSWLEWRKQVRPISPVTVANYRGAIDRYITPNLGRDKVGEVDAATLDTLCARARATGGKCRHCWTRIRRGEPALPAGVRYRPRPGADEAVHEPDGARGWSVLWAPTSARLRWSDATLRRSPPDRFIVRRWASFVGPLRARLWRADDWAGRAFARF
jgi:hypothetical protein